MEENLKNFAEVPKSIEAEECVLGSLLIGSESTTSSILEVLAPKHFFDVTNTKVFEIMAMFAISSKPIDPIAISTECLNQKIFTDENTSNDFFSRIMSRVPSVANAMNYCNIVLEKYRLRELLKLANTIRDSVNSGTNTSQIILEKLSQNIFDMRQNDKTKGLVHIRDIILSAYESLGQISGMEKDKYRGISTGYPELDTIITGLNKSDLLIVAARPGMGKTSFAMNIGTSVAMNSDKQVAVFSLEMSAEQLALRILSSEALVGSHYLKTGELSSEQWTKLGWTSSKLQRSHMYIDDTAGITVQTMKARLQTVENLGLVIIDYLQLISSTSRSDNRVVVVSEITRNIKVMAKELNVPIILLSQLSRGPESRNDKRPMLSDLRESGSIEQDADIVIFLYRDGYYNPTSEKKFISECIVAKNRHGETGKVELGWNGEFTKFTSLERHKVAPT
jgi:replicative DNA helicase